MTRSNNHSLFSLSNISKHLNLPGIFTVMRNRMVTILAQIFLYTSNQILKRQSLVKRYAHFNMFEMHCQIALQKCCSNLHTHHRLIGVSMRLYPAQHSHNFPFSCCRFWDKNSYFIAVVSSISLATSVDEKIFNLFVMYICSLVNCQFMFLPLISTVMFF